MTWQNYRYYLNGVTNASALGGGMIGAVLFAFTYVLFSTTGALFLAIFMFLVGVVFLIDLSLDEFFKNQKKRLAAWRNNRKKNRSKKRDRKSTRLNSSHVAI